MFTPAWLDAWFLPCNDQFCMRWVMDQRVKFAMVFKKLGDEVQLLVKNLVEIQLRPLAV